MLRRLFRFVLLITSYALVFVVGAAVARFVYGGPTTPATPPGRPDEPLASDVYTVEYVGRTPAGTKIYRLSGSKMIVPAFLAEGRDGTVAFR